MALIELGFGISAISGKTGDQIFSRNRGGAYVKKFAIPTGTRTGDQITKMDIWINAGVLWKNLVSDELNSWHDYANHLTRKNRLGGDLKLTANQIFTECYTNAALAGLTPLRTPTEISNRPAINSVGFFLATSSGSFMADYYIDDILATLPGSAGGTALISAAPTQRASVVNVNKQFRLIKTTASGAGRTHLEAEYNTKFGPAASVGWKAHLRIRVIDNTSMLGSTRTLTNTTVIHN